MMRQWSMLALVIGFALTGCARQQSASQPPQQPETLSSTAPVLSDTADALTGGATVVPATGTETASLPETATEIGGPIQIQTALANAGYYSGAIDGKIGPMTQQAIKEFQAAHSLTAD